MICFTQYVIKHIFYLDLENISRIEIGDNCFSWTIEISEEEKRKFLEDSMFELTSKSHPLIIRITDLYSLKTFICGVNSFMNIANVHIFSK